MEDISIFLDKEVIPTDKDLQDNIGLNFDLWNEIKDYVFLKYPKGLAEWNYPGKKFGWSFRIKDKKRTIVYFLPRAGFFKVALVFGQKAYDEIMSSDIAMEIKTELEQAKKYAEGRGIRITVENSSAIEDIKKLIDIKLEN